MFGFCLYGILLVQMYIYHVAFGRKENKIIKGLVYFIFLLETIFTLFTTIAAWNSYGPGWGAIESLLVIDWSWEPLPALNGFIAMMVQSFYVWRIWSLTRNIYICVFIEAIAIVQCAFVTYFGIRVSLEGLKIQALLALTDYITVWLVASAVCDVLITITIVYVLQKANHRTKFKQTTSALTRLIRFTVETGTTTSVMAIVELVLYLTTGKVGNWHFIGFLVLGRLYSNTLVATLNSRAPFFSGENPSTYMGGSTAASAHTASSAFWDDSRSKGHVSTVSRGEVSIGNPGHNAIRVARTTDIHKDGSHEMVVVGDLGSRGPEMQDNKYSARHRDF
jgi:hypothetical protein